MTRASLTSLAAPAVVVGIALLGLQGATARAADPPFRALDSFDRIGVAFLSRQSVFVTTRQDATHDATTAVVQPTAQSTGPFPREIAWAPGAASFAMLAHANEDQLSMVDYPDGTRRDISAGLDPFRHSVVANTQRSLAALRWAGPPTPSSLHVLVSLTEAGVMQTNPDGSGAQLVDSAGTVAGTALFADGHRIVGAGQVNTDSQGRPFNNLFVVDLRTGARTQLTNAPFNNDEGIALSPDEKRVAYVEDAFGVPSQFRATPGFSGDTKLRIVNIDGTNDHAISPETTLYYSEPAWRPDGARIAFVGLRAPGANGLVGRPVLYSETPDGTDLVRHTVETGTEYPFPAPNNTNSLPPTDVAWGRTCTIVAACAIRPTLSGGTTPILQATPSLTNAASIGFLVERYRGKRLVRTGRIPFGVQPKGRAHVRWNLRINGHRLPRGRYRITLRTLAAGNVVIERSRPIDLIVSRDHRLRLARARASA